MVSPSRILLFILSLAVTSALASPATVLSKLKNPVDSPDIPNLISTVNSINNCSGINFLQFHNALKPLVTDINAVTSDASSSAVPTQSQAQTIFDFVCGQLYTDYRNFLKALDAKRTFVRTCGYSTAYVSELKRLRTAIDNLLNALINKAPTSALKSFGTSCKKNYDDAINNYITSIGGTP